jgi:hypothetical protein
MRLAKDMRQNLGLDCEALIVSTVGGGFLRRLLRLFHRHHQMRIGCARVHNIRLCHVRI